VSQVAHNHGLLDARRLETYRLDLQQTLDRFPGLHPAFLQIYDAFPEMRNMPVFAPLVTLRSQQAPKPAAVPPDES
jgi:hypothetical protein